MRRLPPIPGIPLARGVVGPPLARVAHQVDIAGVLPNTPDAMVTWLMNPPGIDPRTAMPDLGLTLSEARDIAAFLYNVGD